MDLRFNGPISRRDMYGGSYMLEYRTEARSPKSGRQDVHKSQGPSGDVAEIF